MAASSKAFLLRLLPLHHLVHILLLNVLLEVLIGIAALAQDHDFIFFEISPPINFLLFPQRITFHSYKTRAYYNRLGSNVTPSTNRIIRSFEVSRAFAFLRLHIDTPLLFNHILLSY